MMLLIYTPVSTLSAFSSSPPGRAAAAARRVKKSHLAGPISSPLREDRAHTNDEPETAAPRASGEGRRGHARHERTPHTHASRPRQAAHDTGRRRREEERRGEEAEPSPTHFPVAICIALPPAPIPPRRTPSLAPPPERSRPGPHSHPSLPPSR